ncbi:MAG: nuclear transport factor 2 family protein [Alphaproteobacteria bacterium]|jgi:ketosteroid isomerase-like protein|nr:nuclear transport factor 2 family protein [Alphaproteobacteria bacterium]
MLKPALLALALVLSAAAALAAGETKPAKAPPDTAVLAEATAAVDGFHKALKTGDKTSALALLDDSVEIFEQGSVERSKAEYTASHLDADIAFSGATRETRTNRGGAILGNLAYITSQTKVTGSYKGKPVNSVSIETMVLHKTGKAWKILHIHWSSRDAK